MRHHKSLRALALGSLSLAAVGCSTQTRPIDPGLINHVVLFKLGDPADIEALKRDCDELLKPIPSVAVYACGGHHETGRPTVDASYDLGLYVSFKDDRAYQAYLADPEHIALVEKWKTRWTDITIYDIEYR